MTQKQILIVEDDGDTQILLKKRLQAWGFSCICERTVESALQALKDLRPSLVILDLGLPGANGTAFLQGAKDWMPEGMKPPPVIILSGHNDKEVVDYALDNGANGFLTKPLDAELLMTMVNNYVEMGTA